MSDYRPITIEELERVARELVAADEDEGYLAMYYILRWKRYPPRFKDDLVEPHPRNFSWHFAEVLDETDRHGPNDAYRALTNVYRRCRERVA